jgi:hypothetical protein
MKEGPNLGVLFITDFIMLLLWEKAKNWSKAKA